MKCKAVIFDLDNTLIDRQKAAYLCMKDIVRECFLQLDEHSVEFESIVQQLLTWDEFGSLDRYSVFQKFVQWHHLDETLAAQYASSWGERFPRYSRVFPDTIKVLNTLKKTHRLGMITNGGQGQRIKLRETQLTPYFEEIIVSKEHDSYKPDRKLFDLLCHRMSLKPEECVFVGDTFSTDILGAVSAGMQAVWIFFDPTRSCDYPVARIQHLSELLSLIEQD